LLTKALAGGMTAIARSAAHLSTATYLHQHGAAVQRIARHLVASSVRSHDTWPTEILLEAAREAARSGDHDTALSFMEHTLHTANSEQYLRAVLLACDIQLLTDWQRGVDLILAYLRELRNEEARVQLLHKLDLALHTRPDPTITAHVLATLAGSGLARWDRLHCIVNDLSSTSVAHVVQQLDHHVAGQPAASAIVQTVGAFKALCVHLTGQDDREAVQQARDVLDDYEYAPSTPFMGAWAALIVLVRTGLHEEAAARAQRLRRSDAPLQSDYVMLLMEAVIALSQGRVNTAQSSLELTLRQLPPDSTLPAPLRIWAVGLLAELLAERSGGEQAWKLLKLHGFAGELASGWQYVSILLPRAGLRAAAGDLDGATRDLKELLRRARMAGVHTSRLHGWSRHGVTRLRQCGLVAEADDAAAEQLQMAEKAGLSLELGRALRVQARVSDGSRAEQSLLDAIDLLQGDDTSAFDLALAQADRGALLLRLGEPDRAVAALVEAADLARRCGAQPLTQQMTALLTAAARHPAPHNPLRGVLILTERERQIFLMATRGTSNRRIAETLEITRRTVELHLSSAYRKLGIAGRRDFPELLSMPGVGPMLEVRAGGTRPGRPPEARHHSGPGDHRLAASHAVSR
jgi:DNA-binding NarL/FixJ family response regulator